MRPLSDAAVAHLRRLGDVPGVLGDRYEILDVLAAGGMGTVYRAHDRQLDREVAVKLLRPECADSESAARLLQEARILGQLEHPGIVPVHEVGTLPDGRVYSVMKRVRGVRLDEAIAGRSLHERLGILERVADAVAFAHAAGVVHRDLKPENVMVGEFGAVLVLDWGIAKRLGAVPEAPAEAMPEPAADGAQPSTGHGTVLGTPAWMAPEQRRGGPVDARTDVHALGALLHFLLVGRPPAGTAVDRNESVLGPRRLDRTVPRALGAVCRKALAEDPGDRYANAREFAAELARYRAGEAVLARRETLLERLARLAVRYRTPLALVATYLLVRILLLTFTER